MSMAGWVDEIPELVRKYVREELRGVYTMAIGIVQSVDSEAMRCRVALKEDQQVVIDDVPIAVPHAGDGYGDIVPVSPDDEAMCMFSKVPLDDLLNDRGHRETDQYRVHSVDDAILFPAHIYYDTDDMPAHAPGDRIWAHDSGTIMRIEETTGDFVVDHPTGSQVAVRNTDPAQIDDATGEPQLGGNEPQATWPDPGEGYLRLSHDSGVDITVGDEGIAVRPAGSATAASDGSGDQKDGREVTSGALNDPWRTELSTHRHLIEHADGTTELTGEPIPHRRLFELFLTSEFTGLDNSGVSELQGARDIFEAYLAWLKTVTQRDLAPDVARDVNGEQIEPTTGVDAWPYPEPVPDGETRQAILDRLYGYGNGGYGAGGYGN